jgi:hypothetical protein
MTFGVCTQASHGVVIVACDVMDVDMAGFISIFLLGPRDGVDRVELFYGTAAASRVSTPHGSCVIWHTLSVISVARDANRVGLFGC